MRKEIIEKAVTDLRPELIEEAAYFSPGKKHPWRWVALAACFALVLGLGLFYFSGARVTVGGMERLYRRTLTASAESGYYVWPWEYRTVWEKYPEGDLDGILYRATEICPEPGDLGEALGEITLTGYDDYREQTHTIRAEAYAIRGVNPERSIAVCLENSCSVYFSGIDSIPKTLGALFGQCDLPALTRISGFTRYSGYREQGYYTLESYDTLWQILSACQAAPAVVSENWDRDDTRSETDYVSFTVTCDALGAYKKALYITQDGYLWTNLFHYAYVYDIGTEAAGEILRWTQEAGVEAAFEPYYESLAGTVTEIGDNYILVDDSVLCVHKRDGMVFKVIVEDMQLLRYIQTERVEEGDLVMVQFKGEVEDGNVIPDAVSLYRAILADGFAAVPE